MAVLILIFGASFVASMVMTEEMAMVANGFMKNQRRLCSTTSEMWILSRFWERPFGLLNVLFVDFELLHSCVFPDIVFQLRGKLQGEGGGVFKVERTTNRDLLF